MRNYKKKTERGQTPKEEMVQAVNRVLYNNESIRSVAKDVNICYVTLSRYVKQAKEKPNNGNNINLDKYGYSKHKQIFTEAQLEELVRYVKHCSKIYFGLSPKEVRKLAYECAIAFNIEVPGSWLKNKVAGEEWLTSFLKKQRTLSIRVPEATSIGRATNFNKPNVNAFFDKLAGIRDRFNFAPSDIWNLDETGLTTVQRLGKVIAEKGTKQVGGITSSERGVLVTLCIAVSAIGNHVPPMFLFPRKRFQNHFIRDGPPGCIGAGNGSGWMTSEEFYTFMHHFVSHVRPSNEKPVLLLLDNHESHTTYKTVKYAKDNGVVLLSFPPHCSHRLQPLDRSVYGPLKKYMTSEQDAWMRNNPGKSMTIYDIPGLAREALPLALAPKNIIKGFQCSGIEPFSRNVFSDDDFLPASVTDKPLPSAPQDIILPTSIDGLLETQINIPFASTATETLYSPAPSTSKQADLNDLALNSLKPDSLTTECCSVQKLSPTPSTSKQADLNNLGSTSIKPAFLVKPCSPVPNFSPAVIRPFPSAASRKQTTRGRKKRKSTVLTDTPELDALKSEAEARLAKKGKMPAVTKQKLKAAKRKMLQDSSDEDDTICVVCCENYGNSKSGEVWIQCRRCKQWAHEECTPGDDPYICHHCDSDDD